MIQQFLIQVIIKELKPETQVDTCTQMFMVALFTIAKKWK